MSENSQKFCEDFVENPENSEPAFSDFKAWSEEEIENFKDANTVNMYHDGTKWSREGQWVICSTIKGVIVGAITETVSIGRKNYRHTVVFPGNSEYDPVDSIEVSEDAIWVAVDMGTDEYEKVKPEEKPVQLPGMHDYAARAATEPVNQPSSGFVNLGSIPGFEL